MHLVNKPCGNTPCDNAHRRAGDRPNTDDAAHDHGVLWLRQLVGCAIVGSAGQHLGHVRDVLVTRTPRRHAPVSGLVIDSGGGRYFAPAETVRRRDDGRMALSTCPQGPRSERDDEVHLAAEVLDKPVLDAAGERRRITDLALVRTADAWVVGAVDTRGAVRRLLGSPRRLIEWNSLVARRVLHGV